LATEIASSKDAPRDAAAEGDTGASILTAPDVADQPIEETATDARVTEHPQVKWRELAMKSQEWRGTWFVMFLADVLALELCVFLGTMTRLSLSPIWPIEISIAQYLDIAVAVLMLPVALNFMGMYPGYGTNPASRLRQRIIASFILFGLLIAWNYLQYKDDLSRGILVASALFAVFVPSIIEALVRHTLITFRRWGQPTVILGGGQTGQAVVRLLQRRPELGFRPIGVFDDDSAKWGTEIDGVRVLGPVAHAGNFSRLPVRNALIAMPRLNGHETAKVLEDLRFENVIIVPHLFGLQSLWVSPVDLEEVVGLQVKNNLLVKHNYFIKRALDFAIGIPAAILSLPILAFAGLWIFLVDGGPIFFVQERRGYKNKRIGVLKLRTMYKDAEKRLVDHLAENPDVREEWERFFKLRKDPRILPGVGRFLRRTSLDELPQVFNVLRGDMSLVGPRPFPDYHLEKFDRRFCDIRSSVLPGLTGFWQISARSDGDLEVQESLDSYYIRNWSVWLDLYVMMRTFIIVIRGTGAY
jgi:Undecaprenyl-phosphate galactose phosphotransferase WbaP